LRIPDSHLTLDPVLHARTEPEHRAVAGDLGERREFHGGHRGVAGVRIDDAEADAHALGRAGDCRGERKRATEEIVLGNPERAVSELFGKTRALDLSPGMDRLEADAELDELSHRPILDSRDS